MRVAGGDKAVGNVLAWATAEGGAEDWSDVLDEHLASACDDIGIPIEALETALDEDADGIVLACAMEDFLSRSFGAARSNVVDAYLQRRGWRESASGKAYLRALRASSLSLYEVVDVVPGRHLIVRDLIRGGPPLQVDEQLGSQNTARWGRLALRLLFLGGKLCLAGGAYHFPHEAASLLIDAVERTAKQQRSAAQRRAKREGQPEDVPLQRIKEDLLPDLAPIFTRSWLLLTLGHAAPLRLVNFDGHDLVFTEVRYPILPDAAAEIERRLDRAPLIERDVEGEPAWTWLRQETRPTVAPARKKAAAKAPSFSYDGESENGRWTFVRVELRCDDLLLTCNSVNCADVAGARLAELLDGLVGPPLKAMQTVDQALADHQARQGERGAAAETVPPEIAGPVLRQFMDEHYRKCLNQPIGMLDGKTPRQAVRSRKGREQVVAWLKYLENGTARQARPDPSTTYDFGWMWAELGIACPPWPAEHSGAQAGNAVNSRLRKPLHGS